MNQRDEVITSKAQWLNSAEECNRKGKGEAKMQLFYRSRAGFRAQKKVDGEIFYRVNPRLEEGDAIAELQRQGFEIKRIDGELHARRDRK